MIKMKKLKINGMSSEDYPKGRIDSFKISLPKEAVHHSHIIPLFLDLGFSKENVLEKLDVILTEIDYIFIYGSPKIKAHLTVKDEEVIIRFDTSLDKSEINKTMGKYFEFPE